MHRIKNHKIKREMPETSTALNDNEEHDLANYIHDRVELMHQVFSVIKPKELKAMAPECVQHISINDLQELCTEELLGISSKRLCAILDGAEPPSDTESSASEQMETISLDSISSDDEILSQPCTKNKKRKHKKHKSKVKHKRKDSDSSDKEREEVEDRSKASRAGLTVLELLELQARARAIRAQLQQDNINMPAEQSTNTAKNDSSDEVEIKEEPAEVVEISSEDEKPKLEDLNVKAPQQKESLQQEDSTQCITENSTTVKRINNLIITVPQTKPSRKIKLKRNKTVTVSINTGTEDKEKTKTDKSDDCNIVSENISKSLSPQKCNESEPKSEQSKSQSKPRKKKKSKKTEKDGSDHDEITLQLSDTEKMDLLEDLNRKDYDSFTSSDSKDSESSSASDSDSLSQKSVNSKGTDTSAALTVEVIEKDTSKSFDNGKATNDKQISEQVIDLVTDNSQNVEKEEINGNNKGDSVLDTGTIPSNNKNDCESSENINNTQQGTDTNPSQDINHSNADVLTVVNGDNTSQTKISEIENNDKKQECIDKEQAEEGEIVKNVEINKDLSQDELSDKNNSDVVLSSEIVCISDEENKMIESLHNKKKQKKSKKEKKVKKSKQDFCESSDQNFFKDDNCQETDNKNKKQQCSKQNSDSVSTEDCENIITIYDDDNDILEILELSDDSDTEGNSVLSNEPTAAEIVALSAKIDEIDNVDNITTNNKDTSESVENDNEVENISWRDRYLGSTKVKKVLTTANILNALRKKNKELKTKLEVAKKASIEAIPPVSESNVLIEGSIEHFNTLQGSTKYVDPVASEERNKNEENSENKVTKEMEKDAKMLLKMYKKLLKYNDMNKQKDPNKKKKKKQKKNKDKEKVKNSE